MIILSSRRDIPILMFLWKWKCASTRAIASRYFYKTTIEIAYKRLLKLNKTGYIQSRRTHGDNKHVWQLSPKGFRAIREMLPHLSQEGYKSEHMAHDLLAAAVHSGAWIKDAPKNVRLYTEQELRRYQRESLPKWFPNDMERRPDGYWDFDLGTSHRLIALEVEISQKSESEYKSISSFYGRNQEIEAVLWVTKDEHLGRYIGRIFGENPNSREDIHNFVKATDFINQGWGAVILSGPNKGESISNLLRRALQPEFNLPINTSSIRVQSVELSPFLNLQKGHRKTKGSPIYKVGESFE